MNLRFRWIAITVVLLLPSWLIAQDEKDLKPVIRTYAITNVSIIQGPGRKIDNGTIVVKDGLIVGVGKGISIPAEAIVIKADSMFAYAGFIDGLSRAGVIKPKEETRDKVKDPGNPSPERAGITPQADVRNSLNASDKSLEELRNLGFTTAQVVPYGNFLPGQASIVLTGAASADAMVLLSKSALYSELTGANGVYPATILGVMAKWRDLYRQASLSKSYESMYASNRAGLERPAMDRTLEAFYPVIDQRLPVLFRTEKFLDANRVLSLKNELNFSVVVADLKDGWPLITKLKANNTKVFLSLDLPEEVKKDEKKDEKKDDKKDVKKEEKKEPEKPKTPAQLEKDGLDKRRVEAIANYSAQASNFQKAGIPFGFSTMSAKAKDIPANLRRMIAAGLTEDAALAALTTTPAQLLGLSDRMGTIDNGKMANMVITDKSYFNEKAKVRYVFVDGAMYKMEVKEVKKSEGTAKAEIEGTWSTVTQSPQGNSDNKVVFKKEGSGYTGTISGGRMPAPVDLKDITLDGTTLTFNYTLTFGANAIKVEVEVSIDGDSLKGTSSVGSFGSFPTEGTKDPKN
ncbi:MAG: amidohydrolase family protein [Cyclobacteriaceae bacterium]|nr:amidohydrolase family protein [Cyclobacteriaceae bacterium]